MPLALWLNGRGMVSHSSSCSTPLKMTDLLLMVFHFERNVSLVSCVIVRSHFLRGSKLFFKFEFIYLFSGLALFRESVLSFKSLIFLGSTSLRVQSFHLHGTDVQDGFVKPMATAYSTLYRSAMTWLQLCENPAVQLHHADRISP